MTNSPPDAPAPSSIDTIELVAIGVSAIAELLAAQETEAVRAASASWDAFVNRLAQSTTPLARLAHRYTLSRFELQCVVCALATQVEPRMNALVAAAGAEIYSRTVTVRLLLERFTFDTRERIGGRQSFQADAPLVRHRVVVLGDGPAGDPDDLLSRTVRLSTPVLHFLLEEVRLSEAVGRIARLRWPEVQLLNVVLPRERLDQVLELVTHRDVYRDTIDQWGFTRVLPYGRGTPILFSGPPGTGKTLLAEALAARAGVPLLSVSAADLPESVGIDAALRDLLAEAAMHDAVVLIDECEALFGKGDKRRASAFRGVEDFNGVLILTTNYPERLDDGLERRLIYHLPFETPDPEERRQIWEVHLPPEVPLDGDIDLSSLATRYDFAGGTIKQAILMAVNRAIALNPKAPTRPETALRPACRARRGRITSPTPRFRCDACRAATAPRRSRRICWCTPPRPRRRAPQTTDR